jgi:1-deoxy-D-xylulose-5-phosphate reductoisomerase
MIEARWLFDVTPSQIEIVVHPQSVIHSMVQFEDTSVIAQLGQPDMRLPIQYALSYPERLNLNIQPLDFATLGSLTLRNPIPTSSEILLLPTNRWPKPETCHAS